ncbi:unnamed protein product [Brassica oleracea]
MLSGTFFMAHTGQTYNRRRPWPPKLNLPGTFCIPLFLLLVKVRVLIWVFGLGFQFFLTIRLCYRVSILKKKPPSYLGKDAHNNRYHSSKDYTCLCCPCDKLTQKVTEAVEFIVVSQHFSNTDHDEDDSQSSNSQTSVTPSMRDRHFPR